MKVYDVQDFSDSDMIRMFTDLGLRKFIQTIPDPEMILVSEYNLLSNAELENKMKEAFEAGANAFVNPIVANLPEFFTGVRVGFEDYLRKKENKL